MAQDTGTNGTAPKKRVRGRWTAEQRQQIVEASLAEGASINEVAEHHGIRVNLLTAWRRRHAAAKAVSKRKKTSAKFAAVRVSTVAADGSIEIDLSNRIVRVRGIVDAGMLREVLAVGDPTCSAKALLPDVPHDRPSRGALTTNRTWIGGSRITGPRPRLGAQSHGLNEPYQMYVSYVAAYSK